VSLLIPKLERGTCFMAIGKPFDSSKPKKTLPNAPCPISFSTLNFFIFFLGYIFDSINLLLYFVW
jgi:hypothetical protein